LAQRLRACLPTCHARGVFRRRCRGSRRPARVLTRVARASRRVARVLARVIRTARRIACVLTRVVLPEMFVARVFDARGAFVVAASFASRRVAASSPRFAFARACHARRL
jgi:hypothetical protein